MWEKALMSSLYTYLRIILIVFINMAKNIGPDGDSAYFSATGSLANTGIHNYGQQLITQCLEGIESSNLTGL